MSRLIYLEDAYRKDFSAVVETHVADNGLILNLTAFYPGGGGQPCDLGTISSGDSTWTVTKVKRVAGNPVHYISGELPALGTPVVGHLDWDRRYKLMRTHTAMHILCGVVWRDYRASVTGGNMEPLKGRMDFEFETMHQELVSAIEAAVNIEVEAARPVKAVFHPREEAFEIPDLIRTKINLLPEGISEIRTIELVGLDLQADGGTHVQNTREVGTMRVTNYKSKGRINKRIYIEIPD